MKSTVFIPAYEKFYSECKPRLLSASCYFGFAPILYAAGVYRQKNSYLGQHVLYSLMVSLLGFWFVVTFFVTALLLFLTRSLGPGNPLVWLVHLIDYLNTGLLLLCLAAWTIGLLCALTARRPYLPILSNLAAQKGWMRLSLYWTVLVQAGLTLLAAITLHGAFLARTTSSPAQTYILYTQGGYIPMEQFYTTYTPPRWTMSLFFYPLVLESNLRWGSGSVAIEPLSGDSFREAIHNGRFVFVASHGGMELGNFTASYSPYMGFLPTDVQPGDAGPQLRYVYFAACDAGARQADWEQALSPAEVMVYDRISYVPEHFLWVWTRGRG